MKIPMMLALLFPPVFACGPSAAVPAPAPKPAPVTTAAAQKPAPDTTKTLATLSRGWNRIGGREGTGCAQDSTFAFRVRPGLPDKVLIFLNGGGACWRGQDCDPKGRPTYTMTADSANDVSVRQGIFDLSNPDNPLREFTMIFVPYCTGDFHMGTRTLDYESKGRRFSVRHEGAANVENVLDWVYANIRNPRVVFVAGSDAGAAPTPVIAAKVARHYPRARVLQLGDAAGGYHIPAISSLLGKWGATEYLRRDNAFRGLEPDEANLEALYIRAGQAAPRVQFAQYNTAEDFAQLAFLAMLNVKNVPLMKQLTIGLGAIRAATPSFKSYLAPGRSHTILRSSALYTTKVDGVMFKDWLGNLVNGDPVEDVGGKVVPAKKKK